MRLPMGRHDVKRCPFFAAETKPMLQFAGLLQIAACSLLSIT